SKWDLNLGLLVHRRVCYPLGYDHPDAQTSTVQRGQDMEVPLHSSQAVRLVFQGLQSPEWTTLWSKGGAKDSRLSEWPGALVLKGVRDGDEGIYRVQDDQGLALSTVRLTPKQIPFQPSTKCFIILQNPLIKHV
uniref:Uncharacterized protein n=1 Tax=Denticeps clupeoides TaxID=299321 RepID=A0AAY4D2N6_9TELE